MRRVRSEITYWFSTHFDAALAFNLCFRRIKENSRLSKRLRGLLISLDCIIFMPVNHKLEVLHYYMT